MSNYDSWKLRTDRDESDFGLVPYDLEIPTNEEQQIDYIDALLQIGIPAQSLGL